MLQGPSREPRPDDVLALRQRAFETPNAIALLAPGRDPLTYLQLWNQIGAKRDELANFGVRPRDVTALGMPGGPELITAFLAIANTGACAPLDPATDIGPVITVSKRDETAAILNRARSDKSVHALEVLHTARAQESWVDAGAYAEPAIICCDQPDHPLVQEETMSPLLVIQRAENFERALAMCNGTRYGLAAALFSNSSELQERFLAEAHAGILKINTPTAGADISLPFGGWKASGLGPPEHGEADRLFYTRMQAVYGAGG